MSIDSKAREALYADAERDDDTGGDEQVLALRAGVPRILAWAPELGRDAVEPEGERDVTPDLEADEERNAEHRKGNRVG